MLCSKLMVPAHGRIQRLTEPLFEGMNNGYRWLLSRALKIPVVILAVGAVVSFAAYNLFLAVPKEFAPGTSRAVRIAARPGTLRRKVSRSPSSNVAEA